MGRQWCKEYGITSSPEIENTGHQQEMNNISFRDQKRPARQSHLEEPAVEVDGRLGDDVVGAEHVAVPHLFKYVGNGLEFVFARFVRTPAIRCSTAHGQLLRWLIPR